MRSFETVKSYLDSKHLGISNTDVRRIADEKQDLARVQILHQVMQEYEVF